MRSSSSTGGGRGEEVSPSSRPRRRWLRYLRNFGLVVAAYLVVTNTWPRKPRIEPISFEAWQQELAARQGSVVVVPVWASWCRDCIEIFPDLIAISDRYQEQGVVFVSLCLEEYSQETEIEAAQQIVRRQGARFPHFLPEQDVAATLDALALDDLPAVLVYDPKGELRYRIAGDRYSNEISLADVEDAIDSLLAEAPVMEGDVTEGQEEPK